MIVVDASAAVSGLLNDGVARAMLAEQAIACPHLIDAEVVHVLRGQVLRGEVTDADASRAVGAWIGLGIERVSAVGALDRAWDLRGNLSGYDAVYVAVAEVLEVPLVTADARLARATGPRCPITVVPR